MIFPSQTQHRIAYFLAFNALVALAYVLSAHASMLLGVSPAKVSVVWFPAGLALAVLLLNGNRLAPAVFVGAVIAQYGASGDFALACIVAPGVTGGAVAGAGLLKRYYPGALSLQGPRDLLALVGIGGFLAATVAATLGVTALAIRYPAAVSEPLDLWLRWWAGDALGVLLLAPLLLMLADRSQRRMAANSRVAGLLVLELAGAAIVFTMLDAPAVYVYLALTVIAAMHLPIAWVTFANLAVFIIAAAGLLAAAGPFATDRLAHAAVNLQTYGIVAGLATLLVSALTAERAQTAARANENLQESKRFLDTLIDAIPTPILVKDRKHRYIAANAAFCRYFGSAHDRLLGKTDYDFFPAEDAAFFQQTDDQASMVRLRSLTSASTAWEAMRTGCWCENQRYCVRMAVPSSCWCCWT